MALAAWELRKPRQAPGDAAHARRRHAAALRRRERPEPAQRAADRFHGRCGPPRAEGRRRQCAAAHRAAGPCPRWRPCAPNPSLPMPMRRAHSTPSRSSSASTSQSAATAADMAAAADAADEHRRGAMPRARSSALPRRVRRSARRRGHSRGGGAARDADRCRQPGARRRSRGAGLAARRRAAHRRVAHRAGGERAALGPRAAPGDHGLRLRAWPLRHLSSGRWRRPRAAERGQPEQARACSIRSTWISSASRAQSVHGAARTAARRARRSTICSTRRASSAQRLPARVQDEQGGARRALRCATRLRGPARAHAESSRDRGAAPARRRVARADRPARLPLLRARRARRCPTPSTTG